ncbi:TonB family protein [Arenimonas sp.]|uniref:TonB family protein n=1 Tax=Arenimonas sp. TaxID=1872635 RepID=UPI0035B0DB87
MAIDWLFEPTLALTGALLAVLVLRTPVRRRFGAAAAYGLWVLVPASLVAVLLPAAAEPVLPVLVRVAPMVVPAASAPAMPAVAEPLAWLPWLWATGALAVLAWLLGQQRRFLAGLGPVSRRPDGFHQCLATRGLPAVVGLRPRIVLPGDFEQRYDALERELVLAHETEHLRRGDLPACLLAAALRVLFWFNPLVHFAAARFRSDQELACDAAVLRRYPGQRRRYGDAMLKTCLADQPLPLGCHWSGFHPMKERLAMLKNSPPSRRRRFAGFVLVSLLGLAAAAVAWAAQPGSHSELAPGKVRLDIRAKVDGEPVPAIMADVDPGQSHQANFEHAGQDWETTWRVTPQADGTFDIKARLLRDGEVVGEPRMITREQAAIGIGEQSPDGSFKGIEIEMTMTLGPPAPGMAAVGIEGEAPAYPEAAANAGEGGMVMLNVLVGLDGRAEEVRFVPEKSTVAEDSEIARNTMQVAAGWKFQPGVEDGKPVRRRVLVPVRFDPPGKSPEA